MTAHTKAVFLAGAALLVGGLGAVGVSGCGGGSKNVSTTRTVPEGLPGTWRLVSISGGLLGGGYPVAEETRVTFTQSGTATRQEGDRITFKGPYQVVRTTSQFGNGDLLVLEYLPKGGSLGQVIKRVDTTQLELSEEAADGYDYHYERVL